jgi:hypothetical protein
MKKYIFTFTIILLKFNIAFADCLIDKDFFQISKETGGAVSCLDKEFYQNKLNTRKGFDNNCIAEGTKIRCKSGTIVDYSDLHNQQMKIADNKRIEDEISTIPIISFTGITEPLWTDRPLNPGDWYGENCMVRVWEKQSKKLIIYRHGSRNGIKSNINNIFVEGLAFPDSDSIMDLDTIPKELITPKFKTQISLSKDNRFTLLSNKIGNCKVEDKKEYCLRAEGVIAPYSRTTKSEQGRLERPLPVIIEDSCAKFKNSNFLDDRPFWHKIPIPH